MLYFIHRKNDDITFGNTEDLQNTVFRLESQAGKVEILGVMPGTDKEFSELYHRFSIYKVKGEDEWFSPVPEILDFIDENATIEQSSVKSSARYKTSEYTPIKQQALHDALNQQINLVVHITEKWKRKVQPYLYFDLHAGPGITQNNQPGSPIIFRRIADEYASKWQNFHYQATLYEADLQNSLSLMRVLGNDARFSIKNEHHEDLRNSLLRRREQSPKDHAWTFGAIYADPSNATLPWELLELFNEVYPRIDVMINIACTSYKRTIAQVGYKTLAERLPRIKEHWIVRKPFGKHQWSILVGTNWTDYPAWQKKEFYPWNDQGMGTSIFEKLVYTPEQRQHKYQLPLFEFPPLDDEDE